MRFALEQKNALLFGLFNFCAPLMLWDQKRVLLSNTVTSRNKLVSNLLSRKQTPQCNLPVYSCIVVQPLNHVVKIKCLQTRTLLLVVCHSKLTVHMPKACSRDKGPGASRTLHHNIFLCTGKRPQEPQAAETSKQNRRATDRFLPVLCVSPPFRPLFFSLFFTSSSPSPHSKACV